MYVKITAINKEKAQVIMNDVVDYNDDDDDDDK